MKKLVFLALLPFMLSSTYATDKRDDHPIVGKWEYVKTILPDGSEVINAVATEHYYADGSLLYVNVWLNPIPTDKYTGTSEEIKNNLRNTIGSIATYTIEEGNEQDRLTYNIVTSTRMEDMGRSYSVGIKVDGDILTFYYNNGNRLIFKRVNSK